MPDVIAPPIKLVSALTVSQIKSEIWLEAAHYRSGAATRQPSIHFRQHQTQPPIDGPSPLPLAALLDLNGSAFVDAAYFTILHRPADDVGMARLMREIAAGTSKVLLLGQLQRSAEGRRTGRDLPGLRRRYFVQRLYQVPVLGLAVRIAAMALRHGGLSRLLGGKAGVSAAHERAALTARIAMIQEAADRRDAAYNAAIETLGRRIGVLQTEQQKMLAGKVTFGELLQRVVRQEEVGTGILATMKAQGDIGDRWEARHLRLGRRMAGLEDSSLESMLAMSELVDQHGIRLARLEAGLTGRAAPVDATGRLVSAESVDAQLTRIEAIATQHRLDMLEQERRIGVLQAALRGKVADGPEALRDDEHAIDRLYVDFEDRFRGSREDIKDRLRFYLPILAESDAGSSQRPVLDVGCGRGEFLELLGEAGLVASGVDANTAMVTLCEQRGLTCVAGDALAYLALQPAGSLGAVTGFHIIEHLPFTTMVRLFDAALLALAPDGVLVFETPNPANLLVASRWFYLDPTHRNPLPGEMVAMIAEARGFTRVSIVPLHPMTQHFGGEASVLRDELDTMFHGPQDYALLARKP